MDNTHDIFQKLQNRVEELEEKIRFYENVLDKVNASICVNSVETKVKWANKRYKEFCGFTVEEMNEYGLQRHFDECYHPDDKEIFMEAACMLVKREIETYTGMFRIKNDGKWKTFLGTCTEFGQYPDGSVKESVNCFIDVSEKMHSTKQIESILKENAQLQYKLLISKLTRREKEVLKHIAEGNSTKKIAIQLNVSFHTIEVHRKNILKKLFVKNTAELASFASKAGIA